MTSIAPVFLNNIETHWCCGLKSVFGGEVHTWKKKFIIWLLVDAQIKVEGQM